MARGGFVYKRRSSEQLERRATQSAGPEGEGFVQPEIKMFSPRKGENRIRILPPTWDDAEHYGLDCFVHYGIGPERAAVICPISNKSMLGRPDHIEEKCPICEARAVVEKDDHASDDEKRELRANKRVLMWVIDKLDRENNDPQLWACPWTLDRDIVKASRDRETGESYHIDDPYDGYDIYFDKEGEQRNTKYGVVFIAKRPSSVEEEHLEFIQALPIPSVLRWRTYAEIDKLFAGGPSTGSASSDRGGSSRRGSIEDERGSLRRDRDDDRRERDDARRDRLLSAGVERSREHDGRDREDDRGEDERRPSSRERRPLPSNRDDEESDRRLDRDESLRDDGRYLRETTRGEHDGKGSSERERDREPAPSSEKPMSAAQKLRERFAQKNRK